MERFIKAHGYYYDNAISELKNGRKLSHWMWYIFPQVLGLGSSATSEFYGIKNLDEAREYLNNELLKSHLDECCEVLLNLESNNALEIFGYPDNLKLKSSMTLFILASNDDLLYKKVINKFFDGELCNNTVRLLNK